VFKTPVSEINQVYVQDNDTKTDGKGKEPFSKEPIPPPVEVQKNDISEKKQGKKTGMISDPDNREDITPNPVPPIPVIEKKRIESIGKSGYKYDEKWAREAAEEDAKKKLENRGIFFDTYEIDESKSWALETDGDGWIAEIVIFIYK